MRLAWLGLGLLLFGRTAPGEMLFPGDGSDEPGFVPPIVGPPPPPPPAHVASGETTIPYPGPPVVPQARSEKKRPPKPPIMFTKIKSDRGLLDWAARPNDLNNLLKNLKQMINVDFASEIKAFDEISADPEKNPILYRTGHFHFQLSAAERQKLRDYLLKGGMIIFNTGMGSKPFYDSAKRELQAVFPEVPVQRLASDHPIFHSYYDLNQVQYRKGVRAAGYNGTEPWFDGVTIDCRTVAVISRWGMEIGWDPLNDDNLQGYGVEDAVKLGVNLLAYATAQRAWAKGVVHAMEFTDTDAGTASKMAIAQVIYDGEWKTRHAGLSVLLQQFNQRTDIPVRFTRKELKLSDSAIYDIPILYVTGHEDFRLSAAEITGLREYLKNGGLLFAEACDGRRAFDAAFRRELAKVLPGESLSRIGSGDQIYSMPNKVTGLAVTPALAAKLGNKSLVAPELYAVDINGHHAVIYSSLGLCGGWELSQNPYSFGYDNAGSLALGVNILFYAITQ